MLWIRKVCTLCIALESLSPRGPRLRSEKLSTTREVKSPTPSLPPKLTWNMKYCYFTHTKLVFRQIANLGGGAVFFRLQFLCNDRPPEYWLLRWQRSCLLSELEHDGLPPIVKTNLRSERGDIVGGVVRL